MKPRWLLRRGGREWREGGGLAVWDNEQRPEEDETGRNHETNCEIRPDKRLLFVGRRRTEIGDGSDGTK